jgi:hypothetical protein
MLHNLAAIVGGVLLIAFIVFRFQQGLKVMPDDRADRGPSVGGGGGDYT